MQGLLLWYVLMNEVLFIEIYIKFYFDFIKFVILLICNDDYFKFFVINFDGKIV